MNYNYADITITPYSEDSSDVLAAMLGEIGFEAFEMTDTGLKAYIPEEQFQKASLDTALDSIQLPGVLFTYTLHHLENKDWNAQWEQDSFDPILERQFGIRLHPRMAFGSGSHATTHQLVSLLMQQDFTGQRVLDMGTGTGVLAIAMAMRGAHEVVAIDIDPFSVENARENLTLNQVTGASVLLGDATAIQGQFQTIVANIHKNILQADMPTYVQHLAPHGQLLLSGFFTADVPDMKETATQLKLSATQIVQQNEWAVMMLRKDE